VLVVAEGIEDLEVVDDESKLRLENKKVLDFLVSFERVRHDSYQHVHHADDENERGSNEEGPEDERMIRVVARIIKVVKADLTQRHLVDESDAAPWCGIHRNCRNLISIGENPIKLELISANYEE
jgi:hypothetical protein